MRIFKTGIKKIGKFSGKYAVIFGVAESEYIAVVDIKLNESLKNQRRFRIKTHKTQSFLFTFIFFYDIIIEKGIRQNIAFIYIVYLNSEYVNRKIPI